MGDFIDNIVVAANNFVWTYIMIAALIFVGVMFTFKNRFVQFSSLGEMIRLLGERKSKDEKENGGEQIKKKRRGTSSFGAFCISIASRVGTGNMAGVATAITLGGPGAIFWMWVVALIGAASSFAESSLAQLYKRHDSDENYVGGPAYYMEKGLNKRSMGVLFAIIIAITFGLFFNSVQSNTIVQSFNSSASYSVEWLAIALTVVTLIVIFGGIKRIVFFSSVIVPIMTISYLALSLFVVFTHIHMFFEVIEMIFESAFGIEQAVGGGVGAAVINGVRRGLFSNEAGMGSAPNAAATASVSHPVKQGLIQTLGVFTDTLIVCSCTAFIILISGVPLDGSLKGIELTQAAMDAMVGDGFGTPFIAICILLFAFSSIIGNYYYGQANIQFITKEKKWLNMYRILVGIMVYWGAVASLESVWNMADLSMAIMALINLVAIFMLRGKVKMLYDDYFKKRRAGIKSPQFKNDEYESWH